MIEQNKIPYQALETVDLEVCGPKEFQERFLEPGVPCILEGLTSGWPAHEKWTKSFFMNEMGQLPVLYHDVDSQDAVAFYQKEFSSMPLSDFIARIEAGEPIRHLGLAHPLYDFVNTEPSLVDDVDLESIRRLIPGDSSWGRTGWTDRSGLWCRRFLRTCSWREPGGYPGGTSIPITVTPFTGACGAVKASSFLRMRIWVAWTPLCMTSITIICAIRWIRKSLRSVQDSWTSMPGRAK